MFLKTHQHLYALSEMYRYTDKKPVSYTHLYLAQARVRACVYASGECGGIRVANAQVG